MKNSEEDIIEVNTKINEERPQEMEVNGNKMRLIGDGLLFEGSTSSGSNN